MEQYSGLNKKVFVGLKINFIKAVRQATGCCLIMAKQAVDSCIAQRTIEDPSLLERDVGTLGDFLRAVRYVEFLSENGIDITRESIDVRAVATLLYNDTPPERTMVQKCYDYWQGR